ncbi:MAB_1171c family putative transporter [Streptomyces adelaidensis]|uniref:MAB_1171c family putative transporter n=1 Tax=Streptomyces adelaidensis TaxID=2796465 RepID=UPI0019046E8B|nr:MAB_1171c family putative transporter [Streptomyces adelaidensis]
MSAMSPADFFGELYIPFWIPTAVLTVALVIKLPSIVKLWRDSSLRAVGGLLLLACSVFLFAVPSVIAWTNRVVGVPNVSAPWVYSLITAFCATCLLLIVAWRNGPADRSPTTRRAKRWVVTGYSAVIVVLWVLFTLADVPRERLRDLDTYYATTPFMREEILLYLVAHTVACLITYRLIRNWVRADGLDLWLRGGLKSLGIGYALNLVYDASKLAALVARWTGHDLDWLSTHVAPPVVAVAAIFIAVGFILPHGGQYLHGRWRVRESHRRLRPLYLLTRTVDDSRVPFTLRATPELRLTRRETFIRDALLQLARHFDEDLRRRAYDAALDLGHGPTPAKALAAAVAIQDALAERKRTPESDATTATLRAGPLVFPDLRIAPVRTAFADLLQDIEAVSLALRHPAEIEAVRALAAVSTADSGVSAHE